MSLLDLLLTPLRTRRVTASYPASSGLEPRRARVTPVLDPLACEAERACEAACPTAALAVTNLQSGFQWRLDYGLCIFCGECARVCPSDAITTSDVFELAQTTRAGVIAVSRIGGSAND